MKIVTTEFTKDNLMSLLNKMFNDYYSNIGDLQDAYDTLDDETNHLLSNYFCYFIGDWTIKYTGSDDDMMKIIESIKNRYQPLHISNPILTGHDIKLKDDLLSFLSTMVEKDMCNGGMDMFTALMIEKDILIPKEYHEFFNIDNTEAEYQLKFLDSETEKLFDKKYYKEKHLKKIMFYIMEHQTVY